MRVLLGGMGTVSAIAGLFVFHWFGGDSYYGVAAARTAAFVLVTGGIATAALSWTRRGRMATAALSLTYIAFNYVVVVGVLPAIERFKPVAPLADVFTRRASARAIIGGYRLMLPSLVYYTSRQVHGLETPDEARAFFSKTADAWVIVDDHRFDELQQAVGGLCVVAERPRMDPTLGDVLAGRPPGDVLLVTNRCDVTN
jgi:hypothetical protein